MALAIDASTPAVATQTVGTVATVATASFTPPNTSLLLIRWAGNSQSGSSPTAPTITDNLGAHLTYTALPWQSHADSPTRDGQAAAWWALVTTGAAMTVTVTNNEPSGTNRQAAIHVTVLTGHDTVTPIGASGKSGSVSAAAIAQSYTASASGGQGFIAVCDWDDKGAETAGTGCTLTNGGSASITGQISYGFLRRTSADDVNGNSNTLNVTIPATSTNLSWVYAEALPAPAGGSTAPPPQVIPAAAQTTRISPIVVAPTIGPPQVIRLPQIVALQFPRVLPGPLPVAVNPPFLSAQVRPVPPIVVAPQARPPQPPTVRVSLAQIPSTAVQAFPAFVLVAPQQFRPWSVPSVALTPPPLPQAPASIIVTPARAQPPLAAVITIVPGPLPQAVAPAVIVTSTWRPRQPQISVSQPAFAAVVPALAPAAVAVVSAFAARPVIRPLVLTPSPLPVAVAGISADGRIVTVTTGGRLTSTDSDRSFVSTDTSSRAVTVDASGRIVSSTQGGRL